MRKAPLWKVMNDIYCSIVLSENPKIPAFLIKAYLSLFGIPLPFKQLRISKIKEFLRSICRNDNVINGIDLGCGVGDIAIKLSVETDCHIEGVDIDEKRIAIANTIAKSYGTQNTFRLMDLKKKQHFSKKYDFIICSCLLGHLKNDIQMIRSFKDIVRKNGYLILCVDMDTRRVISEEKEKAVQHFRSGYNFNRILGLIEEEGFNVIKSCFIDTRDLCNTYFYELSKYIQIVWFPIFYTIVKLSDSYAGKRPNMAVLLAKQG